MKMIAIYLRLSIEDANMTSKEERESNSITNQRASVKEFIHNHLEFSDYEVREYYDDGYSGTNFDRPGIKKLLQDVKRNFINCIIVKDFSRFSRDYIEMGSYLDQIFPFMGIRFIAINDNYDSDCHKGTISEIDTAFKTLLNDFYCQDLSIKVRTVFHNKCANGEYIFGQTPFGYEKIKEEKNQIRIHKEEAKIVRNIFFCLLQE